MKKQKKLHPTNSKYLFPLLIVLFVIFAAVIYQNQQPTNALGQNTYTSQVLGKENTKSPDSEKQEDAEDKEETEEIEEPEEPEPTEVPEAEEPTEKDEQEVEDINHEIENEIEQENIEKVEIHPISNNQEKGTLKVDRTNGTSSEKAVPVSNTPIVQVQNAQAGTVAVSVGRSGTITLVNNGITVTTNYPVVVDPQTQTIAVRTANGITVINTLPSQALNNLKPADKPSVIKSTVLGAQDGQMYYTVTGTQARKFMGILPVNTNVETKINAQDGSVISVDRPWYLDLFGLLYTS